MWEIYFRAESWFYSLEIPGVGRTIGDAMQDDFQIAIRRCLCVMFVMLPIAWVIQRWENARNDPRNSFSREEP